MTDVCEIQSFDAEDFEHFYMQASGQVWYVLNAKRIKDTPPEEQNDIWHEENRMLHKCEDMFHINSDDGFSDIDIGFLFGLYAVLKYYYIGNMSWHEIDEEINELVNEYNSLKSKKNS